MSGLAGTASCLGHFRLAGLHVAVDADRGGEEVARHAHLRGEVGHVDVDQDAVVHDLALGGVDKAHPAHVGRQLVDLVKGAVVQGQRCLAVLRLAQVEHHKLVGLRGRKLVLLAVDAAHPVAFALQPLNQMASDKSACTCNKGSLLIYHNDYLFQRVSLLNLRIQA